MGKNMLNQTSPNNITLVIGSTNYKYDVSRNTVISTLGFTNPQKIHVMIQSRAGRKILKLVE